MAIKIKDLIKKLREKDQNKEVEFIVVDTDGFAVCIDVEMKASHSMEELLSIFGNKEP